MSGLIGLWRLNENAGVNAPDTSLYGNNGTLEGDNPTWVDGISGKAVNFPGTDERVDCGNNVPLNNIGDGDFSISFWMKSKDTVPLNYGGLFEKFVDSPNAIILDSLATTNKIRFYFAKSAVVKTINFDAAPFDTNLNHIVLIVNRTTDKVNLYMNNTKDAQELNVSGIAADSSNSASVSWGARPDGTQPYEGLLDECRIYDRVLTEDEIEFLHNHPDGFPGDSFEAPENVQLKLISPSGELLGILSDTDLSGQILNAKIIDQKIGGVEKFSFQVPRNIDLPITRNTECYFFINSVLWKIGSVKETPKADQEIPILNIEGEGFYKRLLKKVINVTYTTQTLDTIVKAVGNTYLGADVGVFYDVTKIATPTITNITVEFKDKNLLEVFEKLLEIANYDYDNAKYRFYVDNEKDLVFELLSENVQSSFFEGYQYQNPEVSIDNSRIVNKILAFRTISGTPKEVEYVAAYQDTESQGRFSIFEEKITFPDYIDTTTISKICTFILKRRSLPINKIKIENFEIQSTLTFGKYGIFNRRELYWRIIADCDTLEGWDESITDTSFAVSTTHVLTGKRSLKFTTAAGSDGEYVEFILDSVIPLPQKVRIFIYFESVTVEFRVSFYDDYGNEIQVEPGSSDASLLSNQWIRYSQDINQETEVINMEVDPNGATEDFIINYDVSTEYDLDVRHESQLGLLQVKKVRITLLTDSAAVFYIDRLDTFANIYNFHELQLEEIEYNLSSIGLSANMSFGKKEDNIFDEIRGQVEEGNIALEIFSKQ